MPLTEKQIAGLILRHIAGKIKPEESLCLENEYISRTAANRVKFKELVNKGCLREKLKAYYDRQVKEK